GQLLGDQGGSEQLAFQPIAERLGDVWTAAPPGDDHSHTPLSSRSGGGQRTRDRGRRTVGSPDMSARRVVVTGVGAVSRLGLTAASTCEGIVSGCSGVGPITRFDAAGFAVRIAAEVRDFEPESVFGRRRARHLDRVTQLALVATAEAMESSGFDVTASPDRVGVVFDTGIGGIHSLEEGMAVLETRGPE